MAITGTSDLTAFSQTNMMVRSDNDNGRSNSSQPAVLSPVNNADRVTFSREAREMANEGVKPFRPDQSAITAHAKALTYSGAAELTGNVERGSRR